MTQARVSKSFSATLVKDGVNYEILLSTAVFSVDSADGNITESISGYAYKRVGSKRTALALSRYSSTRVDVSYPSGSAPATTQNSSGYFLDTSYNDNSWSGKGSPRQLYVNLYVSGVKVATLPVPLSLKGTPGGTGQTGKMCYIVGVYDPTTEYQSNSKQTVAVEVEVDNSDKTQLWYLDADTNVVNGVHISPSDPNQTIWKKALNDYNLIRTKYLFADFAHLGALIVSGDLMFSQFGFWRDFDGETTAINSITAANPEYLLFDSTDPDGMSTDVTDNVVMVYNATTNQTVSQSMSLAEMSMVVKGTVLKAYYKAYLPKGRYTISGEIASSEPVGTGNIYIQVAKGTANGSVSQVLTFTDEGRTKKAAFVVTEADWFFVSIYTNNSDNVSITVDSVAIHKRKFVPNFYVDMLRGECGLNKISERASIPAKCIKYTVYTADTNEYLPTTADSSVIAQYDTIVIPRSNSAADVTIWLETPSKAKGKKLTIYNISSRKVTIKANNNRGRSNSLQLPSYSIGWGPHDEDSSITNLHKLVLWCNGTCWYELEKLVRDASTGAVLSAFHTP